MAQMITKIPAAWDALSKDIIGDEFAMNVLMDAQEVKSFDSPVYDFVPSTGSLIAIPENINEITEIYKAPWED